MKYCGSEMELGLNSVRIYYVTYPVILMDSSTAIRNRHENMKVIELAKIWG